MTWVVAIGSLRMSSLVSRSGLPKIHHSVSPQSATCPIGILQSNAWYAISSRYATDPSKLQLTSLLGKSGESQTQSPTAIYSGGCQQAVIYGYACNCTQHKTLVWRSIGPSLQLIKASMLCSHQRPMCIDIYINVHDRVMRECKIRN